MPIFLGLAWFLGFIFEAVIGGLLMALIVKEQDD
jgi:hypothetical protein